MDKTDFQQALNDWQRLSPLSIIFFIGKIVTQLIKDALPSMAPLMVVIFSSENKLWMVSGILAVAVVLLLLSSVLQYWFFKFKQQGNKVLINDGVFKKNHRVIQFDRIQNINILQPIYFKPFELVTLQIETAGAKGNEADLAGIPRVFADFLRDSVLHQQYLNNKNAADEHSTDNLNDPAVLLNSSLKDLIKYGISSNGIFWFFVFLAPIFGLGDDFIKEIVTKEDIITITEIFGGGMIANVILVVGIVLVILLLMFGFSILGAIFRYFRYQLVINQQQHNTSLKRTSGLLTTYEESLKLQKIQTFIIQSNFIGRWLKVNNLTLGQVSSGQNNANKRGLFVIPATTKDQVHKLQQIVFPDAPLGIETTGINQRYINKTVMFKLFLPSLLICLPIYFSTENSLIFSLPFIFSAVMLPLVFKRWRAYQYGMKDGYAIFQRGLFGFRHVLFPLYKVQKAEVTQSPIQRRRNLATLKIYLASNRVQMQYIPIEEANRWLDSIGNCIEETKLAWY